MKCPTCDSPSPHLHPAMQHEGEVQICHDQFHLSGPDYPGKPRPEDIHETGAVNNAPWDSIDDFLKVWNSALSGEWVWGKNSDCKYVELRVDMRDGGCIIKDRQGRRISPKALAYQSGYIPILAQLEDIENRTDIPKTGLMGNINGPGCDPEVAESEELQNHDYPACAIFRGGECTCDARDDQQANKVDLQEEVALLKGLFSIIDGMVAGRDENGPIGPKKPYSWESVAMVAFDCAYAALSPNNRIYEPCKVDHVPRDQKTR